MKKIIAIVLALTLALSLAACGGKADDKTITVAASPTPHAEIWKSRNTPTMSSPTWLLTTANWMQTTSSMFPT